MSRRPHKPSRGVALAIALALTALYLLTLVALAGALITTWRG